MRRTIVLVMLCAVGLSGCGGGQGSNLQYIPWQLQTINNAPLPPGMTVTLLLSNNSFSSTVTGHSQYPDTVDGTYTLNGSSLTFSIRDRMTVLSADMTHIALVSEYKETLVQTTSYSVSIGQLTLYDASGHPILTFVP